MARKKTQAIPKKYDFSAFGKLGGRPKAFNSPEEFAESIGRYFGSITRTYADKDGMTDDNGKPVYHTDFIEPPSFTGMCLFLKITKETWNQYSKQDGYSESATYAKMIIESYLESQLMTTKHVQGIIFNLKNNFGWAEKVDVKQGIKVDVQSIEAFLKNGDGADM